jgi:hypothetical protein
MKAVICLLLSIFVLTAYQSSTVRSNESLKGVVYLEKDKQIFEKILQQFSTEKNTPIADLMVKVGTFFKETPYVAHTLEIVPEQLVVNLRELDCTTFAESVLAIARTIKSKTPSFEQFAHELQNIRYRNGKIDGYTTRIHYFSDWIFENNKRNFIKDVSEEIAKIPYPLEVNFMSSHPASYIQLKDSMLIPVIAKQEKEISARQMFYIPEGNLAEFEHLFMVGDIVGFTTNVKGLDISHVAILQRVAGSVHILHASSTAKKVILSEETLEEFLKSSKSVTGIMVARPL